MTEVVETIIQPVLMKITERTKIQKIAVLEGKNTFNIPTKFYHKDGGGAA